MFFALDSLQPSNKRHMFFFSLGFGGRRLAQGYISLLLRRIMMNIGAAINLEQVYVSQAVYLCASVNSVMQHFP